MEHIISVLVENKPGVLARISGLFSARGFNITSLAVGETNDPSMSRMTIVAFAPDERVLDQIKKQLNKLIDVITVVDLTKRQFFERELLLMKVNASGFARQQGAALVKKYAARILSEDNQVVIVEAVGPKTEMNALVEALQPLGIMELVRTGTIAIAREEIKF